MSARHSTYAVASIAALLTLISLLILPRTTMPKPVHRSESLFKHVNTICIGRFLLDVPSTANLVFGRADIPFQATRYPQGARKLAQVIEEEAGLLKENMRFATGALKRNSSDLGRVIDGPIEGQKTFVGLSPLVGDYLALKAFVPVAEDLYVIEGNDLADPVGYSHDLQELNATVARVKPLTHALPQESGFCIDGAFVRDATIQEVERVQLGVQLAEFPDVLFSIEMVRKDREVKSDQLEPRFREAEQALTKNGMQAWRSRIKFFRRGVKALAPWKGDEILARLPPHAADKEAHQFMFVALGEPKNPYIPTLDVSLSTGVSDNRRGGTHPSITDDEAIYLWDRLLGSLRVRPVQK